LALQLFEAHSLVLLALNGPVPSITPAGQLSACKAAWTATGAEERAAGVDALAAALCQAGTRVVLTQPDDGPLVLIDALQPGGWSLSGVCSYRDGIV